MLNGLLTAMLLGGFVLMAGAVKSAMLFTPPLVPYRENVLVCYLSNISTNTRQVTIHVFNRLGEDVIDPVLAKLNPGEERLATAMLATASATTLHHPPYIPHVTVGSKLSIIAFSTLTKVMPG